MDMIQPSQPAATSRLSAPKKPVVAPAVKVLPSANATQLSASIRASTSANIFFITLILR